MPSPSLSLAQPKLLLGEGVDEVRFFNALLSHLKIKDIQVIDYAGKSKLTPFLQTLPKTVGFSQLQKAAITRDADNDWAGAFQSVCHGLQLAGLSIPATPHQTAVGPPAIRIYIIPDNANPGMLEDLCLASVRAHPGYACVDNYFQCAAAAGRRPNNMSKACVHAWLSSEVEPDKQLGVAAEAGYLPWHDPAFAPIINFVQSL